MDTNEYDFSDMPRIEDILEGTAKIDQELTRPVMYAVTMACSLEIAAATMEDISDGHAKLHNFMKFASEHLDEDFVEVANSTIQHMSGTVPERG